MNSIKRVLPRSRAEYLLVGLLALRLLLCLLTVRDPSGGVLVDSTGYLGLANRLWETGAYSNPSNSEPDLLRPPGYALILYMLRTLAGSSTVFIALVQLAVTGMASMGLLMIGSAIGRRQVGLAGAWLLAISPNSALWSLTVMTEVWLAILMVVALALVARDIRDRRLTWPVFSGALLGLASYIRPIAVVILPTWSALGFLWARWVAPIRKAVAQVAGLVITCGLIMAPWVVRNWRVHNQALFSTVTRKTWLGFNLANVISMADGVSRDVAASRLDPAGPLLSQTLRVAGQHPGEFARAQLFGIARTVVGLDIGTWGNVLDHDDWIGLGLLSGLFQSGNGNFVSRLQMLLDDPDAGWRLGIILFSVLYTLVLFLLAGFSLPIIASFKRPERALLTFVAVTAAVLVVTPLAAGQARFRVPAEPLLAFMGGYGWLWLTRRNQMSDLKPQRREQEVFRPFSVHEP